MRPISGYIYQTEGQVRDRRTHTSVVRRVRKSKRASERHRLQSEAGLGSE